ncbi:MAG: AAA-like domain-containing protein [Phormidesmis sp.]
MTALQKKIILFLAANPQDTDRLRLEQEVKEIEEGLLRSTYRDSFEFEQVWATTPRDMRRAILKIRPQLVHFSGHGSGKSGLILENSQGKAKLVSALALSDLFKLFADSVECVVLNACYSDIQAQAIAQHIPHTIGMNQAIGDRAAIEFAVGFYDALGEGRVVEFAFDYACASLTAEGIPEELTPVLIKRTGAQRQGKVSQGKASRKNAPLTGDRNAPKDTPESAPENSRKAVVVSEPNKLAIDPLEHPLAQHEQHLSAPVDPKDIHQESQDGAVDLNSRFYVCSSLEKRAFEAICRPGALVRIKSPFGMGKSSLTIRLLDYAKAQSYRTVTLDFQQTNTRFFEELDKFAQWFCASVGKPLGIRVKTDDYWDDIFGPNDNCTDYFEKYLLTGEPLTLALENFDRLFDYPEIEVDFCGLLRGWHEKAKRDQRWDQLRLVIVYSQESYEPKDINQSPFNVGVPIELGPWTVEEVKNLAARYGLALETTELSCLMDLTGGHPHLVRLTLTPVALGEITICEVLETGATEAGIYRSHLMERLNYLEGKPDLLAAMRQIVNSDEPVRLRSQDAYKLDSMGLIRRQNNEVTPLCEVYRTYFRERLAE